MKKIVEWFKISNRYKHFFVGALLGFVSFVLAVIGAFYKEYADQRKGGQFDKQDIKATILGGVFGQILSVPLWWFLILKLA